MWALCITALEIIFFFLFFFSPQRSQTLRKRVGFIDWEPRSLRVGKAERGLFISPSAATLAQKLQKIKGVLHPNCGGPKCGGLSWCDHKTAILLLKPMSTPLSFLPLCSLQMKWPLSHLPFLRQVRHVEQWESLEVRTRLACPISTRVSTQLLRTCFLICRGDLQVPSSLKTYGFDANNITCSAYRLGCCGN